VGALIAARIVSGLSAGLMTGTATAALTELVPASVGRRAPLAATAANMGGLGLGPLIAGLFAQYAPHPTTYEPETTNYSGAYPYGWCLDHGAGPCAQFSGGQTSASPYALMWQWSGGGGITNGIGGFNGDLDTIDAIRQN
jgi:MFS family permease